MLNNQKKKPGNAKSNLPVQTYNPSPEQTQELGEIMTALFYFVPPADLFMSVTETVLSRQLDAPEGIDMKKEMEDQYLLLKTLQKAHQVLNQEGGNQ